MAAITILLFFLQRQDNKKIKQIAQITLVSSVKYFSKKDIFSDVHKQIPILQPQLRHR